MQAWLANEFSQPAQAVRCIAAFKMCVGASLCPDPLHAAVLPVEPHAPATLAITAPAASHLQAQDRDASELSLSKAVPALVAAPAAVAAAPAVMMSHPTAQESDESELSLSEAAPVPATAPAPVRKARRVRVRPSTMHRRHPDGVRRQELDFLGRATARFRTSLLHAEMLVESCRRSPYYEVLSRTTQPAHIGAFLGVTVLAVLLFPAGRHHQPHPQADALPRDLEPLPWTSLAYILSFAAHFGSQFWMTFVSGLSLFFCLPRHHFAEVQKVLFPLYFAINSFLSLVTLASFLRLSQQGWDSRMAMQVLSMAACFLIELCVRLYLTPPMIKLISSKTEIEKTVKGVGEEVGHYELGPLSHCPHYLRLHAEFRRVHSRVAVANIVTMGCTAFHAHHLASKICF